MNEERHFGEPEEEVQRPQGRGSKGYSQADRRLSSQAQETGEGDVWETRPEKQTRNCNEG